jgi:error-prone DNA polymerase
VIHVVVKRCFNFSGLLKQLTAPKEEELSVTPMSRADEKSAPVLKKKKQEDEVVQGKIFPEGRNFR